MNTESEYLVGIDIGTTTSKGVIVTIRGKTIATCAYEHEVERPHPGWAEHDAEKVWWGDFVRICHTLLQKSSVDPNRILAVGCSALGPAVLPVDSAGRPLYQGILYSIDTRVAEEIEILKASLGDEYSVKISGNRFSAHMILPKILWLRRHEPELFQKTARFCWAHSYVTYRLTGNYVVDHGGASNGGLPYNTNTMAWDENACREVGISNEQMPRLSFAQDVAGKVSAQAAAETGLPQGATVAVGTIDHASEVIGLGALKKGRATISYGTSVILDVCIGPKIKDIPGLLMSRSTTSKDLYLSGGGLTSGAGLAKWFKDNFGQPEMELEHRTGVSAYQSLNNAAGDIKPGCEGLIVLPYFSGERCPIADPGARGVLFGLTLRHTRAHIYRAILEGVAFGVRHLYDTLKSGGVTIESVSMVGGGTASDVWTQIMSDVTGLQQRLPKADTGAHYGAAYLGGLAAGAIDFPFIEKLWDSYEKVVQPNPTNKAIYDKHYQIYRNLYPKTAAEMHLLE